MLRYCLIIAVLLATCPKAIAWGRHDLITRLAIESTGLSRTLEKKVIKAEPIEAAAPDLVKRAIPEVLAWQERYHREHDTRYEWSAPGDPEKAFGKKLTAKEQLLWALQDNIRAPLDFSITASDQEDAPRTPTFGAKGFPSEGTAAKVLTTFVEEPDALIDGHLHQHPYIEKLRDPMSLFFDGGAHTHTFRHYYVPSSLIPPLITPRGMAPQRAALYAELARQAFKTGHRYWGYRFLAWSIHYIQDVTQPWHTVLVPSLSFLKLSKAQMRREISGYHYLTEAMSDSWLQRMLSVPHSAIEGERLPASSPNWKIAASNPFGVAQLTEEAAAKAHARAAEFANDARPLFEPILEQLDDKLAPKVSQIHIGRTEFSMANFDFSGNGKGATESLTPIWKESFELAELRNQMARHIGDAMAWSVVATKATIEYVLKSSGEM